MHATARAIVAHVAMLVGLIAAPPDLQLPVPSPEAATSVPDLDARLAFLEEALEGPELHAEVWWWGWLSFYGLAIAAQGTRLALVDDADEDARAQRADFVVSMVKAALGVASLLFQPLSAAEGAEPMYRISEETSADGLRRLAAGEAALRENAIEAERRYAWWRHLALVGVNLIGGAIIWLGYDDLEKALISAGVGIGVGQIIYFTQPWQPITSYEAYQEGRYQ